MQKPPGPAERILQNRHKALDRVCAVDLICIPGKRCGTGQELVQLVCRKISISSGEDMEHGSLPGQSVCPFLFDRICYLFKICC